MGSDLLNSRNFEHSFLFSIDVQQKQVTRIYEFDQLCDIRQPRLLRAIYFQFKLYKIQPKKLGNSKDTTL